VIVQLQIDLLTVLSVNHLNIYLHFLFGCHLIDNIR
jgi:hypothetical protein